MQRSASGRSSYESAWGRPRLVSLRPAAMRSALFCPSGVMAVPGARKDLLDGLPEAERAIADGEVRRDLEPTLLDVDEEFTPALRALADPSLEADEFLLAFGCCADQHQHAFGIVFHP